MMSDPDLMLVEEDDASRRRPSIAWPVFLAIGWLIYELTAQPSLGAALVCLKFGWNDFHTGFWLYRKDPNRRRGRACGWFYLASGLWKTAITAVVVIMAFACLAASQQARQAPAARQPQGHVVPDWFLMVLLTAFSAFSFSTLATWIALLLARRNRIKLWLSSSTHRYRRNDVWPPFSIDRYPLNQAGRVIATALVCLTIPAIAILCILLGFVANHFGPLAIMSLIFVPFAVGPVLLLIFRDILNQRFVARVPWECWGESARLEDLAEGPA